MDGEQCPVWTGTAAVLVAVVHRTLRQLIVELLQQDHAKWNVTAVPNQRDLADAITAAAPDLVILDVGDFARSCRDSLQAFPRHRVIVIGPEPDVAYERAARQGGAGAWLTRDRVGEELVAAMRSVLGRAPAPLPGTHHLIDTPPITHTGDRR